MGDSNEMGVQFSREVDARNAILIDISSIIFRDKNGVGFINRNFSLLFDRLPEKKTD